QRDSRSHVTHDKFRAGRAMGGSARVALSYVAADGSELYRIQPGTGEGRDGDDGITGRKLPAAAGADYRKESHASSRSDCGDWFIGNFASDCLSLFLNGFAV